MSNKNITVVISSGTIMKAILFALLFVLLYMLRDLVLVLLAAVVIASSIEPATKWLSKYKISRVPAVIFIYFIVFSIFVGIVYFFVPILLNETSRLVSSMPQYIESIDLSEQAKSIGLSGTENFTQGLTKTFSIKEVLNSLNRATASLSGGAFQAVSSIFGGVFSFILIVIISFYLAVQEKGIENFLRVITPIQYESYIIDLWERSQTKIGKWMQGQLILGLLIGVLVYLGLTILGVKYALVLALLAAIAELIPLFGPILAAVPAIALGFMSSLTLGLVVLGFYIIIQQFENHLIYPLVVRKVVGVPPLLVVLSLVIGGQLAGILGLILAVPVAAVLVEFTNDTQKEKRKLISH